MLQMPRPRHRAGCWIGLGLLSLVLHAPVAQAQSGNTTPATTANTTEDSSLAARHERSPWLLVPLVSSSPKLGSSLGLMAGYVTRFDAASSPSMVGLQAKRSDSDSQVMSVFARLYFNEDRDRVIAAVFNGKIHNDYQDYLGSGIEVHAEENMHGFYTRYLHAFAPHWYIGAQLLKGNFAIDGEDPISSDVLDQVGVTGSDSAALGLSLLYDTRNNVNNPTDGVMASLNNKAFRKFMGGENQYDSYAGDLRWYQSTSPRNVVALHGNAGWTHDAPVANQSSISMRGYTRGQYLGQNVLTLEAENRYMFQAKWGAKAFAGLSCLYGGGQSCSGDNLYPMAGVGVFYILKPKENMLISAEFAKGNGDNQGFYLRFGHPF
ncbi:BamA/TamA family outer membrane protein [Variovorax sp. HJSM1_2]|uniref:BamA/TamA family outer membrane protein n=1 Tax=Variovorax sp. HJSM1_2 TaxID=3366263 RepID=UPI003BCD5EE9